ncbi:hypothetical protein SELMODRAFT_418452 [Selaginella moellendorffii]|uniref:Uncharacterized protein n=1 Tax=Selaginella moellendorffii TaxID=88036 RepID=D8S5R6_SELML|nr:hypothetical protein SELMODRAFT_418452 [Selaginella moellendorffii]
MANQVSSKHKQGVQCRGKIQGDHYCVRDKNLHFFQFHEDHSHIDLEFKETISGALTSKKRFLEWKNSLTYGMWKAARHVRELAPEVRAQRDIESVEEWVKLCGHKKQSSGCSHR